MNRLEEILDALIARHQSIAIDGGYLTDIGTDVRSGYMAHHIEDFEGEQLVAIGLGDELPQPLTGSRYTCDQSFLIQVATKARPEPERVLIRARFDIRKALITESDLHPAIEEIALAESGFALQELGPYTFFAQEIRVRFNDDYS